ncbi:hypothetical protein [Granulicella sp. S190]|uniref:hypothetical protein n=1 Tax=Granulicella sp. S190 TaxID=1747226 RepID=UPI00131D0E69|nr:hypothetical protein [Granulicella sp. S190]
MELLLDRVERQGRLPSRSRGEAVQVVQEHLVHRASSMAIVSQSFPTDPSSPQQFDVELSVIDLPNGIGLQSLAPMRQIELSSSGPIVDSLDKSSEPHAGSVGADGNPVILFSAEEVLRKPFVLSTSNTHSNNLQKRFASVLDIRSCLLQAWQRKQRAVMS